MAFWKQFLVTLVVLAAGGGAWIWMDERPGRYLLTADLGLPELVLELVSELSSADDEPLAGEAAASAGAAGSPSAGGPAAGRGGRGGGGPTLVVVDPVTVTTTRNQLRAIATGEAERSVVVHPDATGIVESVSFSSGDEVAAGQVLAVLAKDAEELALDRAKIALAAAQEKLKRYEQLLASRTTTAVEVDAVRRELSGAELDVRAAEIALSRRTITAPIPGRVGIAAVDIGDLVSNQTVIATIDDRSRLKLVFFVPEAMVSELSIGHPLEAVSVADPSEVYRGEVSAIDSRLDEASRTLQVQATIDNPRDILRPGMSFTVTLAFAGEEYLSVDPLSVQWERSGPFVWKVEGDTPGKAPIRIIERNVDRVLVASDVLQRDDLVVTEGLQAIREGAKVRVSGAPAVAAAPEEVSAAAAAPRPQRQVENHALPPSELGVGGAAAAAEPPRASLPPAAAASAEAPAAPPAVVPDVPGVGAVAVPTARPSRSAAP